MSRQNKTLLLFCFFCFTSLISLRSFKKVEIENIEINNNFISKEDILHNSSLQLPKRLILIQTNALEQEIKDNLSLKYISINKQLFPFGLKIYVKTRRPVAYAETTKDNKLVKGYVDSEGIFIPEEFVKLNQNNNDYFNLTIYGWRISSSKQIAEILKINDSTEIHIHEIHISKNGFIKLKEEDLNTVLIGFDKDKITTQLDYLIEIKRQLMKEEIYLNIEVLDLTDPINPEIKVFKP